MFCKKGLFRSSPNQVACTSKPTRSLLVLHTRNAAGELERNRLSHLASPWILISMPLTNRLHGNCQARLRGRIDCAGHGKSTLIRSPHLPRASSKRNDREIERRHRLHVFTLSRTDLLSHWTFENCPKLSSVGHFQSEQAFTPPTHFRTLFGFSEKFGNCRPPLTGPRVAKNAYFLRSPWRCLKSFLPSTVTLLNSLPSSAVSCSSKSSLKHALDLHFVEDKFSFGLL